MNCHSENGQCFSNMAYAYSQLLNIDKASEFYLRAQTAAEKTGNSYLLVVNE